MLHERLAEARSALMQAGIAPDDAALDAEVLARHVLECDRATLLTRARDPLPSAFDRLFQQLLARRLAREPIAYIVGHREFWGLEFEVTPAVLIPRPETELIVEEALRSLPARDAAARIVEVGAGSGCLAVALAVEFPAAHVTATDISHDALAIARRNAERHRVADRIEFLETDLLGHAPDPFDAILSNPPYVPRPDGASLQPEVRDYEPAAALFSGDDGLDAIRRLVPASALRLNPDGLLLFEFGFGQDQAVTELIAATAGLRLVEIRRDLQGIPRVAIAQRERSG
jgi:release factor glutamine methyltransferase